VKQSLAKGTKLGSYSIIRLVGRGGMGEVYEAYEHRLRRTVALKVIAPLEAGQHDEHDLVRRFVKEAHTLAQINHPNVVTIYTIDSEGETQFIAMEYVDGSPLKKMTSLIAMSADEAAPLFLQTLEGLRALHDNQILHRDLKPNNLMVRLDGKVKVLDFGIAKRFGDQRPEQTEVGVVVGTLPYLAPEILAGKRADIRSDLWSLGAIFYECLTGHPLVSLSTRKVRGVRALPDSDVIFPEETLAWIPEEMRTIVARLCDSRSLRQHCRSDRCGSKFPIESSSPSLRVSANLP
jgi:serine/threonine protein kinase